MSILIQNGTLLCPEDPVQADLRTEGEKISQIGPGLPAGDSRCQLPGFEGAKFVLSPHCTGGRTVPKSPTGPGWSTGRRCRGRTGGRRKAGPVCPPGPSRFWR